MNGLEHGWVADGSTGQDDPYYCASCNTCLGHLDPQYENADGEPLCELCWEKLEDEDVS